MLRLQEDPKIYRVKIHQTYWMTDTSEEKMLQLGAVCSEKEVESVSYYDTELYDLAINEIWLSKIRGTWQLIVDRGRQQRSLHMDSKTVKKNPGIGGKDAQNLGLGASKPGPNKTTQGNCDTTSKKSEYSDKSKADQNPTSTCFELVSEREIINYLAETLQTAEDAKELTMEEFLQLAGIQYYASVHITKRATYKLGDKYTIVVTLVETTLKESAEISLDVDIENVTQGFQKIEQLADDLQLQPQAK